MGNSTQNPTKLPQRKSIRLKGYNYSQAGLYFITICTQNRLDLFGMIENGKMILNDAGKIIKQIWDEIPIYYNGFNLHQFIVMPNHIHGIIEIVVGAPPCGCPNENHGQAQGPAPTAPPSVMELGDIIHRYKTLTTKRYIDGVKNKHWQSFNNKLWQRNYWEHIIRNENEYNHIAQYIIDNPEKWQNDKLNAGDGNIIMEPTESYNAKIWMI